VFTLWFEMHRIDMSLKLDLRLAQRWWGRCLLVVFTIDPCDKKRRDEEARRVPDQAVLSK
jgi:hypothetical protein